LFKRLKLKTQILRDALVPTALMLRTRSLRQDIGDDCFLNYNIK